MAGLLNMPGSSRGLFSAPTRQVDPFLEQILMRALQQPVRPSAPVRADAGDEAMFAANPNGRPIPADAGDEAMFAAKPNGTPENQALGQALLSMQPQEAQPGPLSMAPAAPQVASPLAAPPIAAAPHRGRVSGWRVLDRVLGGGQTITGGIDAERTRLEAEALRPTLLARQEAMRAAAERMGPAALIAFQTNPEKFGESLAEQYAPQVIGAGAIQSIAGTGQRIGAPQRFEFGDSESMFDPVTHQMTTLSTRGPTIAEKTAQDRLAWDQQYGTNRLGIDQQDANTRETVAGRPQTVTTGTGAVTSLIGNDGAVQGQIQGRDAPVVRNSANDADNAAIAGFEANNTRFQTILSTIQGDPAKGIEPAFDLSPIAAAGYKLALKTGVGMSPQAAAYGNYSSEIDAAVSDALRLNTGPQTDQDAVREARALLSNRDNKDYVLARLPTVIANNNRLAAARQSLVAQRGGGAQGSVAHPTSAAEYQALPSGTLFQAPDGTTRRKP